LEEKPETPKVEDALRLGQRALELHWITPGQLREALGDQSRDLTDRHYHRPLGNILIEKGYLTEQQLATLLGGQKKPGQPAPFGKYTIVRELGRGGMGVVYEAVDTQLHRKVALKLMLGNALTDPKESRLEEERFLREARLTANLAKHPALVSVYEAGTIDGKRYLAMELIEGTSFGKWRKAGSITIRQQMKVLRDVAQGIHHAHLQGTIHRDIKPDNILVDTHNQPHVTDFGLAKSVGQNVHLSLTASGMIMGTPAYMSPEQALGEKTIDHRTDIYALGVLIYETLTGRQPFTGDTPIEILMKASKDPVPLPSSVVGAGKNPTLDKTIENICLKCLAKKAQDRYESAEGLAEDLSRWLKGEEVQVRLAAPTRRKAPSARKPRGRLGAVIAVSAGALAIFLGFLAYSSSPAPQIPAPSLPASAKAQQLADKAEIERLRRERDQALGDARSARERTESARTEAERTRAAEDLRKAEDRGRASLRDKRTLIESLPAPVPLPAAEPEKTEETWIQSIRSLAPEEQVRQVVYRLKERNPGYDGRETHEIRNNSVTVITFSALRVTDLSPLRAFPKLSQLACEGAYDEKSQEVRIGELSDLAPLRGLPLEGINIRMTRVTDLSPLSGMRLRRINFSATRVSDLAPLRDMPIEILEGWESDIHDLSPLSFQKMIWLNVFRTKVSDLSPLAGAPLRGLLTFGARVTNTATLATLTELREVSLDFDAKRDTTTLKSLKFLEKINDAPVQEFWAKKAPPPAAAADLKTGLVGHWTLRDGSSTAAADLSGSKLRAKLLTGAQWTKGKAGSSLHFDGQNAAVELPNTPVLDKLQTKSYTLSAWFKPDRLPPEAEKSNLCFAIVAKQGWSEGLSYNIKGQFCMDHWLTGDENTMAGTWDNSYPPGRFYHATGVIDVPGGQTRIYVDARLVTTRNWPPGKSTRDFGTEIWRIGINSPGADKYRWAACGTIGDVRLYNRPLSPTEIQALFVLESAAHEE
jgi:serine/threonine protein kinase